MMSHLVTFCRNDPTICSNFMFSIFYSGIVKADSILFFLSQRASQNIPFFKKHWLYKTNPRVGIGMKEAGHFIVVVGGYRSDSPKANLGWNLVEFADLMESLGCQQAYNVDGGVSACMIFMGERLNKGGTKKDWSQLRNLPDGIIFGYSADVPT